MGTTFLLLLALAVLIFSLFHVGRAIRAKRDLFPNERLVSDKPLVLTPRAPEKLNRFEEMMLTPIKIEDPVKVDIAAIALIALALLIMPFLGS